MKSPNTWRPSKYVIRRGRLVPSADSLQLAPSSLLIAHLLTDRYQPALAAYARGTLLDLGCGKVPLFAAYREFVSENVCVDWPRSVHSNEHTDLFCDLSMPLPFNDASFETVLSSDVIEHLPDPSLAFSEISRVLKPGGKLLLNTPFMYMLHEIPHDYYRHTRYSLERLSNLAGMDIICLEEIGGLAEVMTDMTAKALVNIPGVGRHLSVLVQRAAISLQRLGIWKKGKQMSAHRFPIGYFLVATKRTRMTAAADPSKLSQRMTLKP